MASDLSQSLHFDLSDLSICRHKEYILLISTADRDQINWHAHTSEGEFWTCTGVKQISQAAVFDFHVNTLLARPVGPIRSQTTTFLMAEKLPPSPSSASPASVKEAIQKLGLSDVNEGNVVTVDPEKFTPDQKRDFEAMMQQARDQFLKSFTQTRKGTLVQKYKVKVVPDEPETSTSKEGEGKRAPESAQPSDKGAADRNNSQGNNSQGTCGVQGDGVHGLQGGNPNQDVETPQDFFNNFQDRVDYAVHNALINQSGVLVNTLSNMMKSIADGSIAEHQAAGPVYLQGGVFPNCRPLITGAQPFAQPVPPIASSAQPTVPPLTPLPAPAASAPGQPIQLLTREQPQHTGQATNQPTQDQPNYQNYQGGNLNYQYRPPSPQVQYQQGGLAQPQFTRQYNQYEPMQQPSQGAAQQRPWADVIADVMREQFGLRPKETGWFERLPLPNRFKVPDSSKFSGQDGVSTYEHISRFLAQCGEASAVDALRVSLSHLIQEVTLHEQRFAEARKNAKKVNHVYPYMYGSDDDDDDSEIAVAEWVRSKKVIPCQWEKNSGKEERYDFDITMADKIFDLLLREKQIQLPPGHTIPSAEELGKKRYCKWHNSGSHSTNDCKVFRQQIQVAIEGGKIKFDDSKRPMKVDGNPFPVNMVHTVGRTADARRTGGFQMTSARVINKYQRRYDKQQERCYEEDDDGFDPHWGCEFFRFCWNEGMRLPTIEDCPGCCEVAESSSRSYNRNNRLRQTRVPVHQRLGPMNQHGYLEGDEERKTQWCPSGIFIKNQKRRVQRLRNRERFQEVEQEINHWLRKAKPKQEWRVKGQASGADDVVADEAKRLAKGKSVVTASVNMVFTLPAEFGIDQADVDEVEEESARLVLSLEQAVFEKPEGTENRDLKPLYINGYVNGKPMSKMMVDGGAAVNLMPYTTFRKLGRNAEDLIRMNMVLKDFGGNSSETKGVLNVELTVGSKTIPTSFFVIDGKGSYSLLLGRDWIHVNCCIPSTMHQCLIQWQGDKVEIVPADSRLKMENPSYYFEGVVEGSNVYTKDIVDDLDDKQGQGFMSTDDLEEIDIGPGDRPRPTFISKNLSSEFRTKLIELLKEFRDCFAWEYHEMPGLSRSIVEHRLPLKPGFKPYQQPLRRCKADMLEPVKAEIKRLYDAGFIRPCRYAEWVSSIVPVIKKNGKVRVCIDFRDLNKATPKDEYPMPVADQLVDAASGHKILSFMDGNAGYNQIFMAEEDIHKTAFRCPGAIGLFEWVVMTFGLKSAGATYQRAMNYIYHDLIGWLVEVYIDDVVVKSKEIGDHIADLRKVFERKRKYGLKMNPTKCAFGVSAGQFLGFLVHERGIEIAQRSINAIQKIKPPENKKKLQELIGKINFIRRFISNLSGRLEPFTPLLRLKADQQFTWGAEQQKALDNIKEYLSSPPVLIPPQKGYLSDYIYRLVISRLVRS
uniref:B1248C03.3 protein n=1 Tax=Oryza sativa subsp. japonica TaxID=39947 RepID=Q7FAL2_ORYSJ|nr:OSJNBa0042N22.17 [Oryza sativa Japonica Group]CAE76044.1 B1248C03.3 [Oryza sativa Japonica Group]